MNQKTIWTLVVIVILLVLVLVGYFAYQGPMPTEPESITTATSTPSGESYLTKLKIDLTSEIYPTDLSQSNSRLRHYVGRVQNLGDRTVSSIALKINFLDTSGKAIKDQVITANDVLKPNFIEEFQFGGLFVPASWSGRVSYQVTELRFVGESSVYYPPILYRGGLDRPLPEIMIPLGL